jgi:hypothetical protein
MMQSVVASFDAVRDDCSADRVIADPNLNRQYIAATPMSIAEDSLRFCTAFERASAFVEDFVPHRGGRST